MTTTAIVPVSDMERMAISIANSKLFGVTNVDQAMSLLLISQAEGKHPASAIREFHIIKGRPALRADAMLARFQQAGGSINWIERTDTKVTAKFSHPQGGELTSTWTIEDAKRAGLAGSENYKKYPRAMLTARLVSDSIRAVFPSVVTGLYTPEEIQEFDPAPAPAPARVISKPVFKQAAPALPAPTMDTDMEVRQLEHEIENPSTPDTQLFDLMDANKLTEADVLGFCKHKGMKSVPEYVTELTLPTIKRLIEVFPEVITFAFTK